MLITVGVDPHKSSLTAAALDEHRRVLAQQRFAANRAGYRGLWQWAALLPSAVGGRRRQRTRPSGRPTAHRSR